MKKIKVRKIISFSYFSKHFKTIKQMSSEENMASTSENIENTAVNTIDSPSEEIPAEFSDVCY